MHCIAHTVTPRNKNRNKTNKKQPRSGMNTKIAVILERFRWSLSFHWAKDCGDFLPLELAKNCRDFVPLELAKNCRDFVPLELAKDCRDFVLLGLAM